MKRTERSRQIECTTNKAKIKGWEKVKARRMSYILRTPIKKTLRKEHACLQFQNKLFQEDKCFCRFLTDVARISLSLSSLCCKENHRCCNLPGKNLDRKSELGSASGVHGKDGFPLRKTEFRHPPLHFSWPYGFLIYELNVLKIWM